MNKLKVYKFLFLLPFPKVAITDKKFYAKKIIELKNTKRRKITNNKIRVAGVE